jgi:uncharacterized protein (TIGR02217 family)
MSFIETRFPSNLSFGAKGGAGFLTNVVVVESGAEYRNQAWTQQRCAYDVSHAARKEADWTALRDFFFVMRGRANGFRFKDWADYKDDGGGLFTMLTSTTFQMVKRYSVAGQTYDRTIRKPVTGTIATVGGSVASIDYTTGIVTMTTGTPTSWTGEFDVPCRFDIDKLDGEILDKDAGGFLHGLDSVPIVEIRV